MSIAIFKNNLSGNSKVDRDNGIVFGCRIADVNSLAVFADDKGRAREVLITPRVVDSLLALWKKKERGDGHWSHDWIINGDDDAIKSRVATWRNFRKDTEGNLIADAHLWPSAHKEAILHAAENDPEGMMVSQVFDYNGGRDDAMPTRVRAADFVGHGAATTALLSKLSSTEEKTMKITIDDLKELLTQPEARTAILGLLPNTAERDKKIATAILKAANVTDADSQAGDDETDVVGVAILRSQRAVSRQLGSVKTSLSEEDETAIVTKVQSAILSKMGRGPARVERADNRLDETAMLPFTKRLAQQQAAGHTGGVAIMRAKSLASDSEYNEWEAAGRPAPAAVEKQAA